MAHFIPTEFDPATTALLAASAQELDRPVTCSNPLVASHVLEAPQGVAIPLVNWAGKRLRDLDVEINFDVPVHDVRQASGKSFRRHIRDGKLSFVLNLDIADALIFRNQNSATTKRP